LGKLVLITATRDGWDVFGELGMETLMTVREGLMFRTFDEVIDLLKENGFEYRILLGAVMVWVA